MSLRPDNNPLRYARISGLWYLLLLVAGPFSLVYVPGLVIEPGDAVATAENLRANEFLFRLGLAGYALTLIGDLVIAVLLYLLFRPVGRVLALVAFGGRLGTAFVHAVVLLVNLLILLLSADADFTSTFGESRTSGLMLLLLNLNQGAGTVWGIFFAVHCLCIGMLGFRSGFLPQFVGLLMLFAGLGYAVNSFGMMLLPDFSGLFIALVGLGSVGELVFAFWLLLKGVDAEAWQRLAGRTGTVSPTGSNREKQKI